MDFIFPEVKKITVAVSILTVVIIGFTLLTGLFDYRVAVGCFYGALMEIMMFLLLGFVVKNSVQKGHDGAVKYIRKQYALRFFLTFAILAVGGLVPYINVYCAMPMLIAPKITYTTIGFYGLFKDFIKNLSEGKK